MDTGKMAGAMDKMDTGKMDAAPWTRARWMAGHGQDGQGKMAGHGQAWTRARWRDLGSRSSRRPPADQRLGGRRAIRGMEPIHAASGAEALAGDPALPLGQRADPGRHDLERAADLLGQRRLRDPARRDHARQVLPRLVLPALARRSPPGGGDGLALHLHVVLRHQRPALRRLHGLERGVARAGAEPSHVRRGVAGRPPRPGHSQAAAAAAQVQRGAAAGLYRRGRDGGRLAADGPGHLQAGPARLAHHAAGRLPDGAARAFRADHRLRRCSSSSTSPRSSGPGGTTSGRWSSVSRSWATRSRFMEPPREREAVVRGYDARDDRSEQSSAAPLPPDASTEWHPPIRRRPRPDDDLERRSAGCRAGFRLGGAAALAGLAGWRWLVTRSEEDGLPWPLRRVLEFDERLARAAFRTVAALARIPPLRGADAPRQRLDRPRLGPRPGRRGGSGSSARPASSRRGRSRSTRSRPFPGSR